MNLNGTPRTPTGDGKAEAGKGWDRGGDAQGWEGARIVSFHVEEGDTLKCGVRESKV